MGLFHPSCELCSHDETLSQGLQRVFSDPHELLGKSSWQFVSETFLHILVLIGLKFHNLIVTVAGGNIDLR